MQSRGDSEIVSPASPVRPMDQNYMSQYTATANLTAQFQQIMQRQYNGQKVGSRKSSLPSSSQQSINLAQETGGRSSTKNQDLNQLYTNAQKLVEEANGIVTSDSNIQYDDSRAAPNSETHDRQGSYYLDKQSEEDSRSRSYVTQ